MEKRIYLDNAATTPLNEKALEKMLPLFKENFGNPDSPHALGRKAMTAVDLSRDSVAACLGAKPSEIYFTCGGTEADNWAILGGARAQKAQGRTRVLVSSIEHHAAIFAAETLKKEGFEVVWLPVNEGGRVEPSAVEREMDDRVALVAVMRVNNETGVVQPIEEIGKIVKAHGALFFVDAVQAAPHEKIELQKWGADLLSVSSHKLGGPKGCGALYIKSGVRVEKLVGGGEQERGLRGGTLNAPAIVGFAEALKLTEQNREQTETKMKALKNAFLAGISLLEGVTLNGNRENAIDAVLSLRVAGVENATLLYRADLAGLCIAAGSACASASVKPSHVLTAMGLSERAAKECVRVSFGAQNTVEEAEEAAKIFCACVQSIRGANGERA
ncbi:MAG: cysteine desulfurase [Clostridia bacterium]|nr:cysteine desulfurase [Clostridia bacterium]